ncbi:pleiotropic drug resistance protein 3-like [Gossypium australe]|uniref:Pleiotropic drug resistance protein 3-like n=1 Tax=Gossypium australe TaxID=47621 RepID=A0A5B6WCG9_9ROSI|nr:pleiotropic drug resistance protein 3-like [Gossypium australe]
MKEAETVKQYSDRIMSIVNNIRLLRDKFSEARIVENVISTLPEGYKAKISSMKDSRDLSSISLIELINAIYAQEKRRASIQEEHQEGAFQAKSKPTSSTSGYKGKKTWSDKPRRDEPRRRYPPCSHCRRLSHPECKICKQMGHVDKVCRNKGKQKQNQPQQPKVKAQVAEEGCYNEEQVFVVSCSATRRKITKGWLIDSGCTNHMTPNETIFKSIDRSFSTRVKVGNGHYIKIKGKRDVLIDTPTGTKLVSNVLLVPKIDINLFSIAQLLEKGYSMVFKDKECLISDPSRSKLMSVSMTDRRFIVDWSKNSVCAYTTALDESKLWYKRLGHVNYKSLVQLTKRDLVENFTKLVTNEDVCKAWRASKKLQLVHTDVCGPMRTEFLNGSKYFILFIDDYLIFCWGNFLKHKSEVASVFWKFKAAVEIEPGFKLKTLRSDNGTEYTSAMFQSFCDETALNTSSPTPTHLSRIVSVREKIEA